MFTHPSQFHQIASFWYRPAGTLCRALRNPLKGTMSHTVGALTKRNALGGTSMNSKPSKHSTVTSTGHALSGNAYLDARFLAAQAEYESMLRWVGLQPSWKVLDAGAGNGGYLSLLCELVGNLGHITALDL